jgi:hypothetical protein
MGSGGAIEESLSSREIAFQLLSEMEQDDGSRGARRGPAGCGAAGQQQGAAAAAAAGAGSVRAHPLPLPVAPPALATAGGGGGSFGRSSPAPAALASLREQPSDDTLDQSSPFCISQAPLLPEAVEAEALSTAGSKASKLAPHGSAGATKPGNAAPAPPFVTDAAAGDAAAAAAAGSGRGRRRRRVIPLRRVIRDAYEYHGLNELGIFFVFAMVANMVLYFHWTNSTAIFKNTVQDSFKSYGNPDWQSQTLLGVTNMMDGVEYISGWLQFWIQRGQEVGELLNTSSGRFGLVVLLGVQQPDGAFW